MNKTVMLSKFHKYGSRWDSNPRGKVQPPLPPLAGRRLSTSQPRFLIFALASVAESGVITPLFLEFFVYRIQGQKFSRPHSKSVGQSKYVRRFAKILIGSGKLAQFDRALSFPQGRLSPIAPQRCITATRRD